MKLLKTLIEREIKNFDEEILYRSGKENGRWNCMSIEEEKILKSFLSSSLSRIAHETLEAVRVERECGAYGCSLGAYDCAIEQFQAKVDSFLNEGK